MNYQLIKNTEWKEKEINEENKQIPINWSVDTIGKIFKINGGGTPSTINKEFWDGNIPWLGPKEMSKEKSAYIGIGEKNISELGAKKLGNKKILKDSIIISTRAPVGYLKYAKNDLYTNQGCHSLLPSQMVDNQYMYYWLSKNKYILEKKSNGTTFKELSHGSLKSIEFTFPELSNQKLISSILFKQDSIISNIEQLIEKNEIIFNELSEQLLSGNLRLKENDGEISLYKNPEDNWKEVEVNGEKKSIPKDWEVVKIKDITQIIAGQSPESINLINDGIEFHQGNTYFSSKYIKSSNKKIAKNEAKKIAPKNSILISVRAPVGEVNININEIAIGRGLAALKTNINNDYLLNILRYYKEKIIKLGSGSTFEGMKMSEFSNFQVAIVNNKEQENIIYLLLNQEKSIEKLKELLIKEKQKFEWLLDNLLSGNYLVKEIEK